MLFAVCGTVFTVTEAAVKALYQAVSSFIESFRRQSGRKFRESFGRQSCVDKHPAYP
jgi:hypothetical protein